MNEVKQSMTLIGIAIALLVACSLPMAAARIADTGLFFISVPLQNVYEGMPVSFTVTAFTPDGGNITLSADSLPRGAEFGDSTSKGIVSQTFRWTPDRGQAGVYNVTFKASCWENSSTVTVMIIVYDAESISWTKPGVSGSILGEVSSIDLTETFLRRGLAVDRESWSIEPDPVPQAMSIDESEDAVRCAYYDDNVAIYFDKRMEEKEASWIYGFMSEVAHYVASHYGDIRSNRLYAVLFKERHLGGRPGYYYDGCQGIRQNVVYLGSKCWDQNCDWVRDAILHEVAHIVESTVHGRMFSPAFRLWGDSKWSEFFEYAFYNETGRYKDALRRFNDFINTTDDFPRPGTCWFRDWFYPLWLGYGGSKVMSNFFKLVGQYWDCAKSMNWGEFIHFMSAAAGDDLRALASAAFGWPGEWSLLFMKARVDYPDLNSLYTLRDASTATEGRIKPLLF
ncbi:MAG: Ig domain-containing protein [Candidatus Bathyarchaeia archaeon]